MEEIKFALNLRQSVSNPCKSIISFLAITIPFSFLLLMLLTLLIKPTPVFSQSFSLSLSPPDISTQRLTPEKHLPAFGVCQELIGDEALASYQ